MSGYIKCYEAYVNKYTMYGLEFLYSTLFNAWYNSIYKLMLAFI